MIILTRSKVFFHLRNKILKISILNKNFAENVLKNDRSINFDANRNFETFNIRKNILTLILN